MQPVEGCSPGRRAQATMTVTEADTAAALQCGDVHVLATPRVLALAEHAAVLALGSCLPEGKTSVGAWVEVDHLSPSHIGDTVTADAVLLGVHGRRLEFMITLRSGDKEVAHVRHRRVIVSRGRFQQPAGEPATAPEAAPVAAPAPPAGSGPA